MFYEVSWDFWDYISDEADYELTPNSSHFLFIRVDAAGNHGDGAPFGENTLAHAYLPTNHTLGGDMHFNTHFTFSVIEPPPDNGK